MGLGDGVLIKDNHLAALGGGAQAIVEAVRRARALVGAPRLILAAPALRIHPANEPVLRYLSPEIDWEFIALAEHWRRELKVVFRKRSGTAHG